MNTKIQRWSPWTAPMALALLTSAGACAHVSQKDFDARIQTLRGEVSQQITEGDRRTADALGRRVDETDARVAALRSDLNKLEEDFDVKVAVMEDALRFDVPVYFAFDKAEIEAQGREVLARFGQVAEKYYPGAHITVEGFADPSGSEAYNLALGKRRADAVKSLLVADGLAADRIKPVSYGEDAKRLVVGGAMGPGTNGWENRRVVLVIDHIGSLGADAVTDPQGGM